VTGEPAAAPAVRIRPVDQRLRGGAIDACTSHRHGRTLEIAGWLLGADRPVVAVEIAVGPNVLARRPVGLLRPDVLAAFPDAVGAEASGFHVAIGTLQPPEHGVHVSAVLADQARVPFATIEWCGSATDDVPLVSVVIPCFRQAHFLDDSIGSVLEQTYARLEVVVVDDGSPDNTQAVVGKYRGIRYLRQRNAGLTGARNAGFRESRGEYVLFLDADDRLLPGAIAAGMEQFRVRPELGLVAGHFRIIGLDGRVIAAPAPRASGADDYLSLLRDYHVGPPGVMLFRRDVCATLGPFDAGNSPAADVDIALRAAQRFPIYLHDDVVLEYRRHGANMTGDPGVMLASTMAVLRRHRSDAARLPGGRAAYLAGIQHWRRSWGDLLVQKTIADCLAGQPGAALSGFARLARHYPAGIRLLARALWSRAQSSATRW
jgi:GT2 family glycosyltransferase